LSGTKKGAAKGRARLNCNRWREMGRGSCPPRARTAGKVVIKELGRIGVYGDEKENSSEKKPRKWRGRWGGLCVKRKPGGKKKYLKQRDTIAKSTVKLRRKAQLRSRQRPQDLSTITGAWMGRTTCHGQTRQDGPRGDVIVKEIEKPGEWGKRSLKKKKKKK